MELWLPTRKFLYIVPVVFLLAYLCCLAFALILMLTDLLEPTPQGNSWQLSNSRREASWTPPTGSFIDTDSGKAHATRMNASAGVDE